MIAKKQLHPFIFMGIVAVFFCSLLLMPNQSKGKCKAHVTYLKERVLLSWFHCNVMYVIMVIDCRAESVVQLSAG